MKFNLTPIEATVAAIARGEMVIVVDDEDRENEGDLMMAADAVTPEAVAFMMNHARGLICAPMTPERLGALDIPLMVARNEDTMQTAFTVSVDLAEGISTGISAPDRAKTLRALASGESGPRDFRRPGHIFPLRAVPGGVLARRGHTEAAIDLARLAGRAPCGVICEIAMDNGEMARLPDLMRFAIRHGLCIASIEDLAQYLIERQDGQFRQLDVAA